MPVSVKINSSKVKYDDESIHSKYTYEMSSVVSQSNGQIMITPKNIDLEVTTKVKVPRIGVMLVGWGGNNGTTFTGMILANKYGLNWHTKTQVQNPDFLGSVSQVGTFPVGLNEKGEEIFVPIKDMIPMMNPMNLEIDGWDISSMNLADGLQRAGVFDWELQEKLRPLMKDMKPRRSIFSQDFVAANQSDRADNVLNGNKWEQLEQLRVDIRDFKTNKNLDKILVMWVGNTERFSEIIAGLNDTWDNLEKAVKANAHEIAPSTLYAIAAILENCGFINGSPQNALVRGALELARQRGVMVAGDDLKTGQTKLKSVLVDYLVGAGLRPESIVSYNHLGNNDGKNLSAPHTFRSKEITKTGVVEDMVGSNRTLFPNSKGPDHLIVIKYIPSVGDSKRAMDEYVSTIAMGGKNTLVIHNTCEDSLLAAPIMLDLLIFMELFQRMEVQVNGENIILPIGALLGYWLKAPLTSTTNSLFRQRSGVENLLRAALSLSPNSHLHLPLNILDGNNENKLHKHVVNGTTNEIKNFPKNSIPNGIIINGSTIQLENGN